MKEKDSGQDGAEDKEVMKKGGILKGQPGQTRPDVDAARRDSLFGTEVDSGEATPAGTPHVQGEARGFDEGRERPATAMPGTAGALVQNADERVEVVEEVVEAQAQAQQQQQDAKKGNETKVDSHVDATKMVMGDFGFKGQRVDSMMLLQCN